MRQSSLATIRAVEEGAARTRPAASAGFAQALAGSVPALTPTLTSRTPLIASLPPSSQTGSRLCFGGFVLAPDERRLSKDGVPVELGGRSFDLLLALIEQPGRVVPKRELLRRVWPDVTVEDVALRFHMTRLRKALGDGRDGRRLITTQVGVGYGFVGIVKRAEAGSPRPREARAQAMLPSRLDRLIGREHDLRSLVERVDAARLVTIIGPAGVGKTSLAIEAAHELTPRFADGATFIDLAAAESPDMLIPVVATALGLNAAANSPMTIVLDHLQDRRQLLVLDNGEHLVQTAARLCQQIAVAAPGVHMIATSRQAFRARNEHVYRLTPHAAPADVDTGSENALRTSSAVELFLHHLATAGGAVEVALSEVRTIAGICRRLDGLALPIELAAVRAATHGIDATSRMVGNQSSLFWPGQRTAPPHQRTLKASMDWSFNLLSNTERQVFERLSKLDGPFSLEIALEAAVNGDLDIASAAAAIDELADRSLIFLHAGRYRCPEPMRLYGALLSAR